MAVSVSVVTQALGTTSGNVRIGKNSTICGNIQNAAVYGYENNLHYVGNAYLSGAVVIGSTNTFFGGGGGSVAIGVGNTLRGTLDSDVVIGHSNALSGSSNIAYNPGNVVIGQFNDVGAIGCGGETSGTHESIVIGSGNRITSNSIFIGHGNCGYPYTTNIAIGNNWSFGNGVYNAIAIGLNGSGNNGVQGSVSIGTSTNVSTASGYDGGNIAPVAIGYNARALDSYAGAGCGENYPSIAIGPYAIAYSGSITIGSYCGYTSKSINIGNNIYTTGSDESINIGMDIISSGTHSIVIGNRVRLTNYNGLEYYSVVIGGECSGSESVCIGCLEDSSGHNQTTVGGYGVVVGAGARNTSSGAAFGYYADSPIYGVSIGPFASGSYATNFESGDRRIAPIAIGYKAHAVDSYAGASCGAGDYPSIAIGPYAKANSGSIVIGTFSGGSTRNIVIGNHNWLGTNQSILIGHDISSSGAYSVNIGDSIVCHNSGNEATNCVNIGAYSICSGSCSVSVGVSGYVGTCGVAIGYCAHADNGVVVGYNASGCGGGVTIGANSCGFGGIAIGEESICSCGSVCIGSYAHDSCGKNIAIGSGAYVEGYSTGVGVSTYATGGESVALGYSASAHEKSIAIGTYVSANNESITIGSGAYSFGYYSTVVGYAICGGCGCTAFGAVNYAGNCGVAVGYGNYADVGCISIGSGVQSMGSGNFCGFGIAIGQYIYNCGAGIAIGSSVSTERYGLAIGYSCYPRNDSICIGRNLNCSGQSGGCVLIGSGCAAYSRFSVGIGNGVNTGMYSVGIGYSVSVYGSGSVAIGKGYTYVDNTYENCVAIGNNISLTDNNYDNPPTRTNNIAIGSGASITSGSNSVQLGFGTTCGSNTFKYRNTTIVGQNGKIPSSSVDALYDITTPTTTTSTTTTTVDGVTTTSYIRTVTLVDRAVNIVTQGDYATNTPITDVVVNVPTSPGNTKVRDFLMKLTCSATPPSVTFDSSMTFVCDEDEDLVPVEGVNLYSFTEITYQTFLVSRMTVVSATA